MLEIAARLGRTTQATRKLLANRCYRGELRLGERVNLEAHEPLVSEAAWQAAQAKRRPRPAKRLEGVALLATLVRCASCGHIMSRRSSTGGGADQCPKHHSGQPCPAPAAMKADKLDAYLDDLGRGCSTQVSAHGEANEQLVVQARAEVADFKARKARLLGVVAAAGMGSDDDVVAAQLAALDAEHARAKAELEEAEAARPVFERIAVGGEDMGRRDDRREAR